MNQAGGSTTSASGGCATIWRAMAGSRPGRNMNASKITTTATSCSATAMRAAIDAPTSKAMAPRAVSSTPNAKRPAATDASIWPAKMPGTRAQRGMRGPGDGVHDRGRQADAARGARPCS